MMGYLSFFGPGIVLIAQWRIAMEIQGYYILEKET
jgi:hypothetical protein